MTEKFTLDVCLSPSLISNYSLENTIVVIIDIVRASSTICTAISYEIDHLLSIETVEEAMSLKSKGYIVGGERNGDKVDGFDYGNSPLSYMDRKLAGKKIALTTTNGTQTIQKAINGVKESTGNEIVIGAFINYSHLLNYLNRNNKNILLVCSGWNNNPSIEDTLFAGKLAKALEYTNRYNYLSDSVIHSILLYDTAGRNLFDFIMDNSVRFSQNIGQLSTDIRYCLKEDVAKVLPVYRDGKFINLPE